MILTDISAEPQSQWRIQSCSPRQQRLILLCWWFPPHLGLQTSPGCCPVWGAKNLFKSTFYLLKFHQGQLSPSLQSCFIRCTTLPMKQMKRCCLRNEHSSFRHSFDTLTLHLILVAFYLLFSSTLILPVHV